MRQELHNYFEKTDEDKQKLINPIDSKVVAIGIKEKDKEIIGAGKGTAYFLKKKKDEIIKDVLNEKISEYTKDCFERFKITAVDTRINRILPKEVTEKKEDMVLNAAFLINNKRIKEYENVLIYLKAKYADKGLIFDCTGPWPPYNCCGSLKENTGNG